MVERQLRRRGIEDKRALRAMEEVPRERFVPADVRSRAYGDGALPIGEGQTISQPWIVARMTALLALAGAERVLEVGTGSGYSAAVLSRCASHVVTVERHATLADRARATLAELGYRNVEVHAGDGSIGQPDRAPFDAIVVTAAAVSAPPPALLRQLVPGGVLVCPVKGESDDEQLVRVRDGEIEVIAAVRFVPLVEDGS
jgi:protein-L-isoaspartate(D-aspartate) O-methyltransferase